MNEPEMTVPHSSEKFKHFNRVIRDPTISPAARTLYAILWSYADKNGVCWPDLKTLMQHMGYSNFGVRKLIDELITKNAIVKFRRGKMQSNVYNVCATVACVIGLPEMLISSI